MQANPVRTRGHRGGVIPMHRALAHFRLGPMNLITAIFLFVFFTSIWLLFLPRTCQFWNRVFALGIRVLPLHAELGLAQHHLTAFIGFDIPYLRMEPVLPNPQIWWVTSAITVALLAASFVLPNKLIPVIYLLRGILLGASNRADIFRASAGAFPSYARQLYGRTRHCWNSINLYRSPAVRIDLLHLRFRFAEEGLPHRHHNGSPRIISTSPGSSASLVSAKDCSVYAGALHYLRHAHQHFDHHSLLLVGYDVVLPISPRALTEFAIFEDGRSSDC
jgi:hypothetical protein